MISTKKLIYSRLTGNTALTTLIGGADHITNAYPEEITKFPFVAFVDENQSDWEYADNVPHGSHVDVTIHIFTKVNAGLPTTYDIGALVYATMNAEFFNCGTNGEVADPTEGVRHRVMRFSREIVS